ncbi:MAG: hypothetical protein OXH11_09050, partial [Candidatus Aminicenantes bacterium]|nr:hypothetical protein [Candidatus Aminicenantes bacterium]
RLSGDQWIVTEGEDLAEVEAALSGEWLEGAVPLAALGSPGDRPEDEERGYFTFKWTAKTSNDGSHDYVPDGDTYFEVPWGPVDLRISTAVESQGWGWIKREERIGGQE